VRLCPCGLGCCNCNSFVFNWIFVRYLLSVFARPVLYDRIRFDPVFLWSVQTANTAYLLVRCPMIRAESKPAGWTFVSIVTFWFYGLNWHLQEILNEWTYCHGVGNPERMNILPRSYIRVQHNGILQNCRHITIWTQLRTYIEWHILFSQ
jgi:hypothetical protein